MTVALFGLLICFVCYVETLLWRGGSRTGASKGRIYSCIVAYEFSLDVGTLVAYRMSGKSDVSQNPVKSLLVVVGDAVEISFMAMFGVKKAYGP